MNKQILNSVLLFVLAVLLQVLIFKRINLSFGEFDYCHFIIYPIIIISLPFKTPRPLVILIGFLAGLCIDMFYNSPGVHASAAVFIAFLRPTILKFLEPYEGYKIDLSPTLKNMGFNWYLPYVSSMLFIYMIFYFSVEAFSFVFYFEILMRTIFSFIASIIVLLIYEIISSARS